MSYNKTVEELISLVKECDLNEDGGIKDTADSDIDFEKLRVNFELFLNRFEEGLIESNAEELRSMELEAESLER